MIIIASQQWSARGAGEDTSIAKGVGQGGSHESAERLREGTVVAEKVGRFQPAGDRLMFYLSEGNQRFGALENLNLERIAKLVSESPEPLEWRVSGQVTEFQGVNYLLIDRAVLKTRMQRRSIDQK